MFYVLFTSRQFQILTCLTAALMFSGVNPVWATVSWLVLAAWYGVWVWRRPLERADLFMQGMRILTVLLVFVGIVVHVWHR